MVTGNTHQPDIKLVVFTILLLMTSLMLFVFSVYILPFLLWSLNYNVPEFLSYWREYLKSDYGFSQFGANWIIFLLFFIPALVTGVIADILSNAIDKPEEEQSQENNQNKRPISEDVLETMGFGLKLLIILALVVAGVFFIQWVLTTPPIPPES